MLNCFFLKSENTDLNCIELYLQQKNAVGMVRQVQQAMSAVRSSRYPGLQSDLLVEYQVRINAKNRICAIENK